MYSCLLLFCLLTFVDVGITKSTSHETKIKIRSSHRNSSSEALNKPQTWQSASSEEDNDSEDVNEDTESNTVRKHKKRNRRKITPGTKHKTQTNRRTANTYKTIANKKHYKYNVINTKTSSQNVDERIRRSISAINNGLSNKYASEQSIHRFIPSSVSIESSNSLETSDFDDSDKSANLFPEKNNSEITLDDLESLAKNVYNQTGLRNQKESKIKNNQYLSYASASKYSRAWQHPQKAGSVNKDNDWAVSRTTPSIIDKSKNLRNLGSGKLEIPHHNLDIPKYFVKNMISNQNIAKNKYRGNGQSTISPYKSQGEFENNNTFGSDHSAIFNIKYKIDNELSKLHEIEELVALELNSKENASLLLRDIWSEFDTKIKDKLYVTLKQVNELETKLNNVKALIDYQGNLKTKLKSVEVLLLKANEESNSIKHQMAQHGYEKIIKEAQIWLGQIEYEFSKNIKTEKHNQLVNSMDIENNIKLSLKRLQILQDHIKKKIKEVQKQIQQNLDSFIITMKSAQTILNENESEKNVDFQKYLNYSYKSYAKIQLALKNKMELIKKSCGEHFERFKNEIKFAQQFQKEIQAKFDNVLIKSQNEHKNSIEQFKMVLKLRKNDEQENKESNALVIPHSYNGLLKNLQDMLKVPQQGQTEMKKKVQYSKLLYDQAKQTLKDKLTDYAKLQKKYADECIHIFMSTKRLQKQTEDNFDTNITIINEQLAHFGQQRIEEEYRSLIRNVEYWQQRANYAFDNFIANVKKRQKNAQDRFESNMKDAQNWVQESKKKMLVYIEDAIKLQGLYWANITMLTIITDDNIDKAKKATDQFKKAIEDAQDWVEQAEKGIIHIINETRVLQGLIDNRLTRIISEAKTWQMQSQKRFKIKIINVLKEKRPINTQQLQQPATNFTNNYNDTVQSWEIEIPVNTNIVHNPDYNSKDNLKSRAKYLLAQLYYTRNEFYKNVTNANKILYFFSNGTLLYKKDQIDHTFIKMHKTLSEVYNDFNIQINALELELQKMQSNETVNIQQASENIDKKIKHTKEWLDQNEAEFNKTVQDLLKWQQQVENTVDNYAETLQLQDQFYKTLESAKKWLKQNYDEFLHNINAVQKMQNDTDHDFSVFINDITQIQQEYERGSVKFLNEIEKVKIEVENVKHYPNDEMIQLQQWGMTTMSHQQQWYQKINNKFRKQIEDANTRLQYIQVGDITKYMQNQDKIGLVVNEAQKLQENACDEFQQKLNGSETRQREGLVELKETVDDMLPLQLSIIKELKSKAAEIKNEHTKLISQLNKSIDIFISQYDQYTNNLGVNYQHLFNKKNNEMYHEIMNNTQTWLNHTMDEFEKKIEMFQNIHKDNQNESIRIIERLLNREQQAREKLKFHLELARNWEKLHLIAFNKITSEAVKQQNVTHTKILDSINNAYYKSNATPGLPEQEKKMMKHQYEVALLWLQRQKEAFNLKLNNVLDFQKQAQFRFDSDIKSAENTQNQAHEGFRDSIEEVEEWQRNSLKEFAAIVKDAKERNKELQKLLITKISNELIYGTTNTIKSINDSVIIGGQQAREKCYNNTQWQDITQKSQNKAVHKSGMTVNTQTWRDQSHNKFDDRVKESADKLYDHLGNIKRYVRTWQHDFMIILGDERFLPQEYEQALNDFQRKISLELDALNNIKEELANKNNVMPQLQNAIDYLDNIITSIQDLQQRAEYFNGNNANIKYVVPKSQWNFESKLNDPVKSALKLFNNLNEKLGYLFNNEIINTLDALHKAKHFAGKHNMNIK